MEDTQNNCHSLLDWGSMQDLTLWSINDHKGEESVAELEFYTWGGQWVAEAN